ncbi:enoyl-CoA hydratase-related protein [uncultured Methylobacterium sp.]|uniref:enoyl-CoA hydratase-related protein n=1 Tax=uncultured Methylobacterium sp. TaxID=157278 RepID=UPI0035C94568
MSEHVAVIDGEDGVRLIALNRPEKKNALTGAMYDTMRRALETADGIDAVGAVVFAGVPGLFCAGNDIADFVAQTGEAFAEAPSLRFIRQLARTRTPMVAAVDGIAVGIGTTLTLHCDLVYASPAARFRMPFVELGLVPEAASSYLLPRRVGRLKATELLLLSEALGADAAEALGLVNGVLPADMLLEHALAQAARLAALPRGALAASRTLIRGDQALVEAALDAEAEAFERQLRTEEAQAAFRAFLARSKPGAQA